MQKTNTIQEFFNAIEKPINKVLLNKNWVFWGVLLAFLIATFFYVGLNHHYPYIKLKGLYLHNIGFSTKLLGDNGYPIYYGSFIQLQAKDLLASHPGLNPNGHEVNMAFRFTQPLLVKIFHLDILGLFLFQFFIIGYLYYATILKLSYQIFENKTLAFYFLLGMLGLYMGNVTIYDVMNNGDLIGYCFLVLAIFYRSPVLVFLFSQVAFWTDERALINSSFLVIWWFFEETNNFKWRNILKKQVLAIFVSWAVYLIVRFSLQKMYHLSIPVGNGTGINMDTLLHSFDIFGAKLWQAYEVYLFMLVIVFYILYKHRSWILLGLISVSLFVSLAVSLVVIDTPRSLSYTLILMFISARLLKRTLEPNELRYLLASLAFISVFYPTFF